MKKLLCVVLIALFALSAFAAGTTGKGNMFLSSGGQIGGKRLDPGDYKLQWTGDGNDIKVTVFQGKKEVVSAPAKLVDRAENARDNAVVKGDDGSIKQVWFGGKKMTIVFE
jgi:hypothetical protein